VRWRWAIFAGLVLGIGLSWWVSRDSPEQAQARRQRAEQAAAANAEDARPVLYRWRDADGMLQVTAQPPSGKDAGRKYERIDQQPRAGIEVHGDRD
jgi:hypothetical protein